MFQLFLNFVLERVVKAIKLSCFVKQHFFILRTQCAQYQNIFHLYSLYLQSYEYVFSKLKCINQELYLNIYEYFERFSLSPILCRTHGYKQFFFQRTINSWNSLSNQFFPEDYNMNLFQKRCYAYFISILDEVIFDVIDGLPNVSTSPFQLIN